MGWKWRLSDESRHECENEKRIRKSVCSYPTRSNTIDQDDSTDLILGSKVHYNLMLNWITYEMYISYPRLSNRSTFNSVFGNPEKLNVGYESKYETDLLKK